MSLQFEQADAVAVDQYGYPVIGIRLLRCLSCGSLVMQKDRVIHESFHASLSGCLDGPRPSP